MPELLYSVVLGGLQNGFMLPALNAALLARGAARLCHLLR